MRLGYHFATGSAKESFPCSASMSASEQVNCFVTDPTANIVCGVTGACDDRSLTPYPFARTTRPLCITPTDNPTMCFSATVCVMMLSSCAAVTD